MNKHTKSSEKGKKIDFLAVKISYKLLYFRRAFEGKTGQYDRAEQA